MRIKWLDGLKGLACFAVLWHHFILAFLPGQYNGTMGKISIIDPVQTPLSFIVNGNFMVTLFMVLSGIAAALSIMKMEDKTKLADIFRKRYPRLMLPILPIALLTWLFCRYHIFISSDMAQYTQSGYMVSWYCEPIALHDVIKSAVITSWFGTDVIISGIFWVLPYFMWGFMLAAVLSVVAWRDSDFTIWFYLGAVVLTGFVDSYIMAFVLGVLIVYVRDKYEIVRADTAGNRIISVFALVIGLFLGGYPSGVMPSNVYRFLPILEQFTRSSFDFYHVVGAGLVVYGIYNLKIVQKLFETKLLQLCGRISYEVFLIHMLVMCSLSCYVFRLLYLTFEVGYKGAVIITFFVTNILVFFVALGFQKVMSLVRY